MNIITNKQKKKLEELKIQLQTEGINLTILWRGVQASLNAFIIAGIVLFMFPESPWPEEWLNGFVVGVFLMMMLTSKPVVYYIKLIYNFFYKIKKPRTEEAKD